MTIITVKAAPGMRVPYEDNARKYITEDKPMSVLETTYYLRRLADKDLVRCEAESAADTPTPTDASPGSDKASAQADQTKAPSDAATDPTDTDHVAPGAGARARTTKTKGA